MLIAPGAVSALLGLCLLVAAQLFGLLGFVTAMRWCWGGVLACAIISAVIGHRPK
jgi:hypothetical protein